MTEALPLVLLAGTLVSAVMFLLGFWSTRRHIAAARRSKTLPDASYPAVSLLKPIKGLEEELEANLRSFFEQDYPGTIEIVFSAEDPVADPGIAVARRVAADYPHVAARVVASDPDFGLNPKVSNLEGARAAARYDLVFQSDANVRARPDYLRRVVGELMADDASLLSSLVIGVGERSIGAALENLHLTSLIAPSVCTALHVGGVRCVIGKSMLFRRSELASLGGLEVVRDILCEDFIIGQLYHRANKTVLVSTTTIENVNIDTSVDRFFARHSRWLKMRAVIHFGSFIADLFANPVAWAAAAVIASRFSPIALAVLAASLVFKMSIEAWYMRSLRSEQMSLGHIFLSPFKDLAMPFVWVYCLFSRSVEWRGRKLRFGQQSRLRHDDGILPVRLARRLLG